MKKIQQFGNGGNAIAEGNYSYAEGGDAGDSTRGPGGDGGSARAIAQNSIAVGGKGGRGGVGKGGPGMDVVADQEGVMAYGGEGGESCQHDGRGGRGGCAPGLDWFGFEAMRRARMKIPYGAPNIFPGRGGDSPDTPQYKARRLIVERIKTAHFVAAGQSIENNNVWYDRTVVPLEWINDRLRRDGHQWQAQVEDDEYVFTDLIT